MKTTEASKSRIKSPVSGRRPGGFLGVRFPEAIGLSIFTAIFLVSCAGEEADLKEPAGKRRTESVSSPQEETGRASFQDAELVRHPLIDQEGKVFAHVVYNMQIEEWITWSTVFGIEWALDYITPKLETYEWKPALPVAEGSDIEAEHYSYILSRAASREEVGPTSYTTETADGWMRAVIGVPRRISPTESHTPLTFRYRTGAAKVDRYPLLGPWTKETTTASLEGETWWSAKLPAPAVVSSTTTEGHCVYYYGKHSIGRPWKVEGDCFSIQIPDADAQGPKPGSLTFSYFVDRKDLGKFEGRTAPLEVRREAARTLLFQEGVFDRHQRPSIYLPTPSEIHIPYTVGPESDLYFSLMPWRCSGVTGKLIYEIGCLVGEATKEHRTLFRREMPILDDGILQWEAHRIPLDEFAGKKVDFFISTDADTSHPFSIPAFFGAPRVVSRVGSPKPNLILVVSDANRADHLGCYGYERDISPNVDRLAAEGMRFDACFSNSSWTLPSIISVFTGRYSKPIGFKGAGFRLPDEYPTLAKVLADEGYYTVGVVGNPLFHPGSNVFRDFTAFDYELYVMTPDCAAKTTDAALDFLSHPLPEPFFLLVHYMDPHMPLGLNGEEVGRFTQKDYEGPLRPRFYDWDGRPYEDPEDRRFVKDLYDGDIWYTDREFGRLLDGIDNGRSASGRNISENTIVTFIADHGEEYWDHGGRPLGFGCTQYERGLEHGHTFYQELIRVPFIIRYPGVVKPGTVCSKPVSLLDFAPTFLDLAGIDPEVMGKDIDGISLVETIRRQKDPERRTLFLDAPVFGTPKMGIVEFPWKLVYHMDSGQSELYDLSSDPRETKNLAVEDWKRSESMLSRILDFNAVQCREGRKQTIEITALGDGALHRYNCIFESPLRMGRPLLAFPAAISRNKRDNKQVLEIAFESDSATKSIVLAVGAVDQPIVCTLEIDGATDTAEVFCGAALDHPGVMPFRLDLLPTGSNKPETMPPGPGWVVSAWREYYKLEGAREGGIADYDAKTQQSLRNMRYIE